jgi:hypothetical protein
MKLIEEIKKAEEKAEKLKKNADKEGQKLIEKERENAKKALAQAENDKEVLIDEIRAGVKSDVAKRTKEMEKEHKKALDTLIKNAQKHKDNAVKKAQEIIIAWPSSH